MTNITIVAWKSGQVFSRGRQGICTDAKQYQEGLLVLNFLQLHSQNSLFEWISK